jgi:non-ribosomal peptide synthase protein (TIGR01720 family)
LPLTPNGKVDRRALPDPAETRSELGEGFVAPLTSAEKLLAEIWAQVLNLDKVGINDNFFELGGDSILAIQIIARTNQAGLQLSAMDLFQHQTIAELATVVGTVPTTKVEQKAVTGPVPLTPIQHWFFEQNLPEPHHFNMAVLLELGQDLVPSMLESAVHHLLMHHDALRLRFVREKTGWRQFNADLDRAVPSVILVDISTLSEAEMRSTIEVAATALQSSLDLSRGPLMRVALFDRGSQKPNRLLIVIHHHAVDIISWRILLEDLGTAYQQLCQDKAIELPSKTTSFKHWAERLVEYAQSAVLRQELDYWLAEPRTQVSRLPVDFSGGLNVVASARLVSTSLTAQETRALLREVPATYNVQVSDVLLTALLQAFTRWTGERSLLVDLESHGREAIIDGVDLSRTVGWFTSIYPVLLGLGEAQDPIEVLKLVKEQIRRIPNGGIGYGLLRYLSKDTDIVKGLETRPRAEVSFNYLSRISQAHSGASLFTPVQEPSGPTFSLLGERRYLLAVNGLVAGDQLQMHWVYSENVHQHSTIESLARSFMEELGLLIARCQSPEVSRYTPSDFPSARLSQRELDKFINRLGEKVRE